MVRFQRYLEVLVGFRVGLLGEIRQKESFQVFSLDIEWMVVMFIK